MTWEVEVGMVGGVRGKTGPLEVVVGQATVEGGSWGEGPGFPQA